MRERRPQNFNWKYTIGWENEEYEVVDIPHTNTMLPLHYFDEKIMQFQSKYKKEMLIEKRENQIVKLRFYGVQNSCIVKLDGTVVGEHKGGYDAFDIELTSYIKETGRYSVEVLTDSSEDPKIPPFGGVVDYLCYGGIYREVELWYLPVKHLEHPFVYPTYEDGSWHVNVEILGKNLKGYSVAVEIEGQKFENKIETEKLLCKHRVEGVTTWDIESPRLYDVILQLKDGDVLDCTTVRIGFRTTEFRKDGFYLNNKKVKIRGLNRHQSYAYVGYAMPASMQVQDADILKYDLGCNLVRTAHYPQSQHFIERCDEIGLLVFTEIPGWQHISVDEQWRNLVLDNCENMILQYRNHPSIIIWGVRINESQDDKDLYTKTNAIAKQLDSTRATGGVRFIDKSELLEDVYTFNDFSHTGDNRGLRKKRAVTSNMKKSYLITEYNGHMYPTKSFDDEHHRTSHALRHANVLDAMMSDGEIAGCIGWCMNDYNTHKDFGSGDRICYHGVMNIFRMPKLASYVYASQQNEKTVFKLNTNMQIGEHAKGQIEKIVAFTNCDEIELYKNGELVKRFDRTMAVHKGLENPPIVIDDLIGALILKNENYPLGLAKGVKDLLLDVNRYGMGNLPLKTKALAGYLMVKYKLTMNECIRLYNQYIGNWGMESLEYKLIAYKRNNKVAETTLGTYKEKKYCIRYSSTTLIESDTYDVLQVFIEAKDQNGHTLDYYTEQVCVSVEEGIDVYGPKNFCMTAGQASFYIKSCQKSGIFGVTVQIGEDKFLQKVEVKIV